MFSDVMVPGDVVHILSNKERLERLCCGYIRVESTQIIPNDLYMIALQFVGIDGISILSPTERQNIMIHEWKLRKLIKYLSNGRGNGTSMISLIIPPNRTIDQIDNLLISEQGTASCIKSRRNRLSVISAITSIRETLKLYKKTPTNGLVIYCGLSVMDKDKENKILIHFEPFKRINKSLYLCDKFHINPLQKLLESSSKFGFIIIDV